MHYNISVWVELNGDNYLRIDCCPERAMFTGKVEGGRQHFRELLAKAASLISFFN